VHGVELGGFERRLALSHLARHLVEAAVLDVTGVEARGAEAEAVALELQRGEGDEREGPEQAAAGGVSFDDLVLWITEDAYARASAGGNAGSVATEGQAGR
jgi:hypothetical protein